MKSPSVCPSAPPIALTDVAKRRATRSSKTQLRPPPTIVYLRPLVFRACWIGMLALHAGLAAYYIALAKLHQHLRDPLKNPYKYVFYFLGPQYPPFFVVVVACATILAVCHLLAIMSMVTQSLRSKAVSFGTSPRVIKPRSGSKLIMPVNGPQRLIAIVQGWLDIVMGRYGWLGVDYHHVRLVFVCRELFEISCQIIKANRLSHLVGVVWINRLFALVVVANYIVLSGTNLTKAPDDMHKSWTRIKFFSLEASPMVTAIPPSVGLIKTLLGVNMNLLGAQVIPDQLFANNSLRQIILDGNSLNFGIEATPMLTEIPRSVGSMNSLVALSLVNNSIASIPDQLFASNADVIKFQHINVAQIPLEWFTLNPLGNPYIYIRYHLGPIYPHFFEPVIVGALCIAAGHLLAILSMLYQSLRSRNLSFQAPIRGKKMSRARSINKLNESPKGFHRVLWVVQKGFQVIFGRYGVLGIDYRYARLVFVSRELFEISCQVVQANRLSNLINVVWINRLFVLVVVANCWSSPLIRLLCSRLYRFPHQDHQRVSLEKVLDVFSDGLLSIVYAAIIPYAIFQAYYSQFNVKTQLFDLSYYYSDDWFIRAAISLKQVFVASWFDLLCLLVPGITTLSSLTTVKSCLYRIPKRVAIATQVSITTVTAFNADTRTRSTQEIDPLKRTLSSSFSLGPRRTRVITLILSTLLSLLGLFVLIAHIHATTVAIFEADSGCLLELRPWGKTTYTCVTLEVSCTQKGIQGEQDKINTIIEGIDSQGLQSLVFSHCPRLEMPSRIRTLMNLKRLKVFNSTVAVWDKSAAISATTNPIFGFAFLIETNFTTFPEGFLDPNLSPMLTDIMFSGTNLTTIPDNLHTSWSQVKYVGFEMAPGITTVSSTFPLIKPLVGINFIGGSISSIPDQLFANNAMVLYVLDGNPISELPSTLGLPRVLGTIRFQHTKVSQIPIEWFTLYGKPNVLGKYPVIIAGHTPLCNALLQGDYSSIVTKSGNVAVTRVSAVSFNVGVFPVDCVSRPLVRFYPLAAELNWRRKNHQAV
ncbi:hypothetical protein Poli38472_013477 [Pythium oligandrum]|uniref:Uncharacterized protein n=1 Tax=Pythium oligandrum TaxID=41045 RepID=A0A8K1FGQ9_PYTOL|nr:hypothetical protein Poli38472_013477 [Pythium oligandrum]|eukprot:TMW58003.1 hypothetical protein Poli38472_013477 [Pythium oligandrum]